MRPHAHDAHGVRSTCESVTSNYGGSRSDAVTGSTSRKYHPYSLSGTYGVGMLQSTPYCVFGVGCTCARPWSGSVGLPASVCPSGPKEPPGRSWRLLGLQWHSVLRTLETTASRPTVLRIPTCNSCTTTIALRALSHTHGGFTVDC